MPGAFGNTVCHGPGLFGAVGLPSVTQWVLQESRGVATMARDRDLADAAVTVPVDDEFNWRVAPT